MPGAFAWEALDREHLRRALASPAPRDAPPASRAAAIAALLAHGSAGVEILLIRRAERLGDPWSGHMALPGGHREPGDFDLLATALRETREEIGVDLAQQAELLGRLDDMTPATSARVVVRPFVFALDAQPALKASSEVERAIWTPLADLASGSRAAVYELVHAGQRLSFEGFRVGDRVVWGLTYRVLGSLLARAAL